MYETIMDTCVVKHIHTVCVIILTYICDQACENQPYEYTKPPITIIT